MKAPLEPPASHTVRAAQGWLELGNCAEAQLELERLPRAFWNHPHVLQVRWGIQAGQENWVAALELATALTESEPEEALGWVHRSYSLHELKRTREARDNLLQVVERFPLSATLLYNLACYECQLGDLPQARKWLEKAFRVGDRKSMRLAALQDLDLQPLWDELRPQQL